MIIKRRLGACGLEVSALGVGCWAIGGPDTNLGLPMGWGQIDEREARAGLERAYDLGANLFDTADVYGHGRSERLLGGLVKDLDRRDDVVLSSKVGYFAGTAAHGYERNHMRRQLEQTLDNLHTHYLDIYFFHHSEFGEHDELLEPALAAMREFQNDGLVTALGMRGPHRYALDRVIARIGRCDKTARFRELFDKIRPDVLAVRDNLLTPQDRSQGIFAFAAKHDCGVLVNKPLAQGLLTGRYDPATPRSFGAGDHRSRKRWFTQPALEIIDAGLTELRAEVGTAAEPLIRIALWSCLTRYEHAAVLVGFSTADQITANLTALGVEPARTELARAREIMGWVQSRLDAAGEVFLDERPGDTS